MINAVKKYVKRTKLLNHYSYKLHKYCSRSKIPVLICAYNRSHFVKKIIKQLNKFNIKPIILDNNSKEKNLLKFYKNKKFKKKYYLLRLDENYGPYIIYKKFILNYLPNYFAYSDPDIEINRNINKQFLNILKNYTDKYKIQKVGFEINVENVKNIKIRVGTRNKNNKIISKLVSLKKIMKKKTKDIIQKNPIIYRGRIDTTFCIYNKKFLEKNKLTALLIGDNFSCKHLPWEKNYKIPKNENKFYIKTKIKDVSSTHFF
jgi:hypothetical protein